MKILYIDAFSGISGDKMVAALLSLSKDLIKILNEALQSLEIKNQFEIEILEKNVMGINSLKFNVNLKNDHKHDHNNDHHDHDEHRNLHKIIKIINNSKITENAKKNAIQMFNIIGKAEAKVHNVSIDKIHFHEVGAVDSIVDIVSSAVLIDALKFDKIYCSHIPTGTGFVNAGHGKLPVPAPATCEILTGIPIYTGNIQSELTTPTGAAIAKYFTDEFADLNDLIIQKTGYGAGSKDLEIPNILRLYICEVKCKMENTDVIISLETNIDDSTPEQLGFLIEHLLQKGALDVFITPIIMKKNRPGQLLTVLCNKDDSMMLENEIFNNSTTFGIRRSVMERTILQREFKTINIDGTDIRIKLGYLDGKLIHKSIEYESVKDATKKLGLSYNELLKRINAVLYKE